MGSDAAARDSVWQLFGDELAERLAEHLAPRVAELLARLGEDTTPWLTMREAIAYTRLPSSTFRKLAASGRIPSHGGRSRLFYRPEIDQALLGFTGIADEERGLRSVR